MTFPLQDRLMYLGQCDDPYITAHDIHTAKVHRSGWLSSILDDYWCSTQTTASTKPTKVSSTPQTSSQTKHVTDRQDKAQVNRNVIIDSTNARSNEVNEPGKTVEGVAQTDAEIVDQCNDSLDENDAQVVQSECERQLKVQITNEAELHKEPSMEMEQTSATSTKNKTESQDKPNAKEQQQQHRENQYSEETSVSVIVDKLFDKIRLNAVKVVALDDLNQQLMEHFAKLSGTNEEATQTTTTAAAPIINSSTNVAEITIPARIPAASLEWPIVNGLELSQCLYSLRAQVQQLREQVIAREEYLAEHERQVKLELMHANHKSKHTRHIKVQVVRAYEEEPKPYVKPPYRPVSWPKPKTGNISRNENNVSDTSSTATSTNMHSSFTSSNALHESESSFPTYATRSPVSSVIATESTHSLSDYADSTNTRSHKSVRSDSIVEKTSKKEQSRHSTHTSATSFPRSSSKEYSSESYSETSSSLISETSGMSSAESKDSALELYRRRRREVVRTTIGNKQVRDKQPEFAHSKPETVLEVLQIALNENK